MVNIAPLDVTAPPTVGWVKPQSPDLLQLPLEFLAYIAVPLFEILSGKRFNVQLTVIFFTAFATAPALYPAL